jgi:hypothetical protein
VRSKVVGSRQSRRERKHGKITEPATGIDRSMVMLKDKCDRALSKRDAADKSSNDARIMHSDVLRRRRNARHQD